MDAAGSAPDSAGDAGYRKVGEILFDFERRRLSVVVERDGERLLITKGGALPAAGGAGSAPLTRRPRRPAAGRLQVRADSRHPHVVHPRCSVTFARGCALSQTFIALAAPRAPSGFPFLEPVGRLSCRLVCTHSSPPPETSSRPARRFYSTRP